MLAQPLQATTNNVPLPHVISVSYGVCESTVKAVHRVAHDRRAPAQGDRRAGHHDRRRRGRHRLSACARGVPPSKLTSADKKLQVSWPASSSWVLAVGGTNLTLDAGNAIAATGAWNDTVYPFPFTRDRGRGRWPEHVRQAPVVAARAVVRDAPATAWCPTSPPSRTRAPATRSSAPAGVQGCPGAGQSIAYVGGTSAATPLVAGMIALWTQQARATDARGRASSRRCSTRSRATSPQAFVDVTQGGNALFGGSCCPARPGYDLATGWGSPLANVVAALLP